MNKRNSVSIDLSSMKWASSHQANPSRISQPQKISKKALKPGCKRLPANSAETQLSSMRLHISSGHASTHKNALEESLKLPPKSSAQENTLPDCLCLTIPQDLLTIAANQNKHPNQTALVDGMLNQSQGVQVSIYMCEDGNIQITFQASGGRSVVTEIKGSLVCNLSSMNNTYRIVDGINSSPGTNDPNVISRPGSKDISAGVVKKENVQNVWCEEEGEGFGEEHDLEGEKVDTEIKESASGQRGNLKNSYNFHGLEYLNGSKLNFAKTPGGNVLCEICDTVKIYTKMYMVRNHLSDYHGILWPDYVDYVKSKGQPEAGSMKEVLIKKSKDHRATKLMKADYEKMAAPGSDDEAEITMLDCPICRKYTGPAEQVLAHLRRAHRKHSGRDLFTTSLIGTIPENKLANFAHLLFSESRQRSKVDGTDLYRCILCPKVDFTNFGYVRAHVLKRHFITWFDYVKILHEDDEVEKLKRIEAVQEHSKEEMAKYHELTGMEIELGVRKYKYSDNMDKVIIKTSKKSPILCPECSKPFVKGMRLMAHIQSAHALHSNMQDLIMRADDEISEKTLESSKIKRDLLQQCCYCDRQRSGMLLFAHITRCHSSEPTCKDKLMAMKDEYVTLKKATKPQDKIGSYSCQYCSKIFRVSARCRNHENYHCKSNPKRCQFVCNLCSGSFKGRTQVSLDAHIARKHENPEECQLLTCRLCRGFKSLTQSGLDAHIVRRHKGCVLDGQYRCQVCRVFRTDSQQALDTHVAKAHTDSDSHPVYPCHYCDKVYIWPGSRYNHVKAAHPNERAAGNVDKLVSAGQISCELCDRVFQSEIKLRNHVSARHRQHHLYQCALCCQNFTTEKSLHTHECGKKIKPAIVETITIRGGQTDSGNMESILTSLEASGVQEKTLCDAETHDVADILGQIEDQIPDKSCGQQYVITTADGNTYDIVYVDGVKEESGEPLTGKDCTTEVTFPASSSVVEMANDVDTSYNKLPQSHVMADNLRNVNVDSVAPHRVLLPDGRVIELEMKSTIL